MDSQRKDVGILAMDIYFPPTFVNQVRISFWITFSPFPSLLSSSFSSLWNFDLGNLDRLPHCCLDLKLEEVYTAMAFSSFFGTFFLNLCFESLSAVSTMEELPHLICSHSLFCSLVKKIYGEKDWDLLVCFRNHWKLMMGQVKENTLSD